MRLRVLGCSGGIGGRHLRTTSFLVDNDVLIDAGSGVGDLPLAELARIDHIFVTHSHLDHVTSIPFLVDTVGGMRDRPVTIHASAATIEILKNHLFNWAIWPDFAEIPTPEAPFLRYAPIEVGETVTLAGRQFTALPAIHGGTAGAEASVLAETAVPWLRNTSRLARSALKAYFHPLEPVLPPSW